MRLWWVPWTNEHAALLVVMPHSAPARQTRPLDAPPWTDQLAPGHGPSGMWGNLPPCGRPVLPRRRWRLRPSGACVNGGLAGLAGPAWFRSIYESNEVLGTINSNWDFAKAQWGIDHP